MSSQTDNLQMVKELIERTEELGITPTTLGWNLIYEVADSIEKGKGNISKYGDFYDFRTSNLEHFKNTDHTLERKFQFTDKGLDVRDEFRINKETEVSSVGFQKSSSNGLIVEEKRGTTGINSHFNRAEYDSNKELTYFCDVDEKNGVKSSKAVQFFKTGTSLSMTDGKETKNYLCESGKVLPSDLVTAGYGMDSISIYMQNNGIACPELPATTITEKQFNELLEQKLTEVQEAHRR